MCVCVCLGGGRLREDKCETYEKLKSKTLDIFLVFVILVYPVAVDWISLFAVASWFLSFIKIFKKLLSLCFCLCSWNVYAKYFIAPFAFFFPLIFALLYFDACHYSVSVCVFVCLCDVCKSCIFI